MTRIQLVLALLLGGTLLALPVWPQVHPIDAEHSVITVRVFKSGLLSAFADNHEIRAPISSGSLDETGQRVELYRFTEASGLRSKFGSGKAP
jgi:hypothetical protein